MTTCRLVEDALALCAGGPRILFGGRPLPDDLQCVDMGAKLLKPNFSNRYRMTVIAKGYQNHCINHRQTSCCGVQGSIQLDHIQKKRTNWIISLSVIV
jgi:hypothetical protein